MLLKGLNKLTLLDFPDKIACIVFTGGCDFRCPFCQNAALVTDFDDGMVDEEEFFAFLKARKNCLDGVVLTGGEPLLQPDVVPFIYRIREEGYAVKLDTNGYHPDKLKTLLDAGALDYVAMDIKNSPEKYAETAGIKELDFSRIRRSKDMIMSLAPDYEFRTTVVKEFHTASDFYGIGSVVKGAGKHYLQRFRDEGGNIAGGLTPPSEQELNEYASILSDFVESVQIR